MNTLMRWAVVQGVAVLLTGCGSIHLYDKAADAAATSAKADYDASKITEAIKAARAVHDALDAKEIEAFRAATLAERDLQLLSLLSDSGTSKPKTTADGLVSRFRTFADGRLVELVGGAANPGVELVKIDNATLAVSLAERSEGKARELLATVQPAFKALPACDKSISALKDSENPQKAFDLLENPGFKLSEVPIAATWTPLIKALGSACDTLLSNRKELAALFPGMGTQLGDATKAASDQKVALEALRARAEAAGREAQAAAKALAAAQKAVKDANASIDLTCDLTKAKAPAPGAAASPVAGGDKPSAPGGPAAKKSELCDALGKLGSLKDFGIKVVSEERLRQIDAILAALGGAPPNAADPELETALALISTTSRFAQALNQYQQAGKLPALEPLLIDKQLTTAQLAYAQAGVQLAEARVKYALDYRDATYLEGMLLLRAKAELGGLGPAPAGGVACDAANAVRCATMTQILEDKRLAHVGDRGGESTLRITYRALAYLSESYSVARDRQRTAELRLIDSDYREALIRAEASLANWNAVLSVPIDQLQAYHAGGVTPQETAALTAQLLQTLGVLGIAVRIK